MSLCYLCPRKCGADRDNGILGYCKKTSEITAARASLHMWEEPCISGKNGSGTVFFSGCTLKCVYCQNSVIALDGNGAVVSENDLADIFFKLQDKGAHNINLVTPTHYTVQIAKLLTKIKPKLKIPIVYNTSGYELKETLKMLDGLIDIYLPDFKYMQPDTAKKYSNAPDYPEVAKVALCEMVRQKPVFSFDADGTMTSGVIVRNLLLPGNLKNSKEVVGYVYSEYGDSVYLSLMNQYTPVIKNENFPELNSKTTRREYQKLVEYAIKTGVKNAYIQDSESSSDAFVPLFGKDAVLLDF